ncbi:response regulator transcription factor [Brachybacterium fresconis]|uniref:DNA-binding NarL/FixJ family response regulator n=1 Tax=Brachybacterium fresconis TaxID=173363 RepID=A0ABS4YPN6_9MICO|nr:DNA-binding NarL/FixJ family response regulator [Brachybacterium fresconis]
MRILLAEDAALLRDGLVALLERAGHDVVAAVATATELAAEAAARIPAGAVDLVVTDVRMPPGHGDDGLRAALLIRQEHPTMPIIVLSQYVEQRYASALLGIARDSASTRTTTAVSVATAGLGYLLKDRVSKVHDFLEALEVVHGGGVVVDPLVVNALMSRETSALEMLSSRELEVLELVSRGETNEQISERLHLSRGAVVKHVSAVFDRLGISELDGNRRVLAVIAFLRDQPPER